MHPIIKLIVVGEMRVNCYLVFDDATKECAIIDPGDESDKIKRNIEKLKLDPKLIINTHGHIDHIGADDYFDLPVYIHQKDADFLVKPEKNLSQYFSVSFVSKSKIKLVEDKDRIKLNNFSFEVIHTPGHTPGGICLKLDNYLFSGDTLFCQGVGRTDFTYGSEKELFESIKNKLFTLSDKTLVYPGHGPATNIGEEKKGNFLVNYA